MVICGVIFVSEEVEKAIRKVYDRHNPLASHVRPHLTLLFPSETELRPGEIYTHFENIASETVRFNIGFNGVKLRPEDLLAYLDVSEGAGRLRLLNRKLYSGEFEELLDRDRPFYPHLTLGRFETKVEMNRAYEELKDFDLTLDFTAERLSLLQRKAPHRWETIRTFDFRKKDPELEAPE
jgi:2'-5' RNA ligase